MRVFYLPLSSCELSTQRLRENMRRWHWRQYFLNLRCEKAAARLLHMDYGDQDEVQYYHQQAHYHRALAHSIEKSLQNRL